MIDFTNCVINKYKYYGGKICIVYQNEDCMLKFSPINESIISEHEYSNSCVSDNG